MNSVEVPPAPPTGELGHDDAPSPRLRGGGGSLGPPLAVLFVTLAATGALAAISQSLYTRNEQRLLRLRVHEAGSLLSSSLPSLQTPLASAAELAEATNGNVAKFRRFVSNSVGPGHTFVSISLWRLGSPSRGPVTVVGVAPKLESSMGGTAPFFASAANTPTLGVLGLLTPPDPRIGYAYVTPQARSRYVAYGEVALPKSGHSRYQSSSAFADLYYALYLGAGQNRADLLVSDARALPLGGRHAVQTIPFGDRPLTLVMSPRGPLSGSLPQRLPVIVLAVGVLLALGAATLTLRLSQRRRDAERLAERLETAAGENRRLYAEQRGIAQTLQHALLPEVLPQLPGIETGARYEAGERAVEIGGDWYDLIAQGDQRLLLVVGDVSGRGLRAATTMASLRYAIRAYAAQQDPPATILAKLSRLVSVAADGQLATVSCLLLDIERREINLTSAGHLPPLLIAGGRSDYLKCEVGLPIGVDASASYISATIAIPRAGTLLAFTDGLVERRGESLDDGLARLRRAVAAYDGELSALLNRLVVELQHEPSEDDIAIVGLRWTG